ncbi:Calcium-dependent protein kinase 3 [Hibiscus syriacus]|uniref:non-specific serine/threonine protein kinase n=1 Tax=Hibiscus syriacus TaxID=106335 RepID=A0A6A3AS63_HIBSY|nr:Calcium-dependent protein kinase 3 [Hibiscus syriacus]
MGAREEELQQVRDISGFKFGSLPVRYLGVPFVTRRLTEKDYSPLLEKVVRVNSWAARVLSYADRIQLVQSILCNVQAYWCRHFVLPKAMHRRMTQLCSRFFKIGCDKQAHGAKVSWEWVCKLKNKPANRSPARPSPRGNSLTRTSRMPEREVQIKHHLTGQANILGLKGAYEDRHSVHLVMELCSGGELFDRIIAKGHYTERAAASLMRTIVQIATDFGLSVFYRPGEEFKDIVGSAYYIAPEVLKRKYGPEADIWSIGVMLYILLSGVPIFWAAPAKDLVKKMSTLDPKQRLTAVQVPMLNRLKQFKAVNQFKKVALRVITGCLSEEEIMGLKEMFKGMDTDNSGTITLEDLRQGLAKQGTKLSEYEVKQLMEAMEIEPYTTMSSSRTLHMNRMDRVYHAFQHFDKDNSGFITTEELEQALREYGMHDGRDLKEILTDVDNDNQLHCQLFGGKIILQGGRIDYDEFVAMMRKGNPKRTRRSGVTRYSSDLLSWSLHGKIPTSRSLLEKEVQWSKTEVKNRVEGDIHSDAPIDGFVDEDKPLTLRDAW